MHPHSLATEGSNVPFEGDIIQLAAEVIHGTLERDLDKLSWKVGREDLQGWPTCRAGALVECPEITLLAELSLHRRFEGTTLQCSGFPSLLGLLQAETPRFPTLQVFLSLHLGS